MNRTQYSIEVKDGNGNIVHTETVKANDLEHLKGLVVFIARVVYGDDIPDDKIEDLQFDFFYGSNDYMISAIKNCSGYLVYLIQAKAS